MRVCFSHEGEFKASTYDLLCRVPWPRFFEIEQVRARLNAESELWKEFLHSEKRAP